MSAIEFINETKQENQQAVEIVQPEFTEEEQRSKKTRKVLKWVVISIAVASVCLLCYIINNLYQLLA